jgi:hypothetical protein
MAKKRAGVSASAQSMAARLDPDVTALLDGARHPLRADIERVRVLVLAASERAGEGVKWNSASYRASDWFATVNLRSRDAVQLVFHTGAKAKDSAMKGVDVADPAGLLKWLAKDRALVTLGAGEEIDERADAFVRLVREWIELADGFALVTQAQAASKGSAKKLAKKATTTKAVTKKAATKKSAAKKRATKKT